MQWQLVSILASHVTDKTSRLQVAALQFFRFFLFLYRAIFPTAYKSAQQVCFLSFHRIDDGNCY